MEHHNLFDQSQIEQIIRRLQQIENKLDVLISGLGQTTKPNPNTKWADNPQAVEIDALIERAGRLTVGEIKAVDAVYNATHANTRHNAILASQYIARYAARYAAYTAAWDTHYYAAGGAAAALIVRDLIDEETPWNQEAYDTLTAPWAEVIGPAHPDDVVR